MTDFPLFYTSNNRNNDNELASTWWLTDCRRTFLSSGYIVFCTKLYGWMHAEWSTFDNYNDTCTLHVRVGGRNHRSCVQIYVNRDLTRERKASKTSPGFNQGEKKMTVKRKTSLDAFSDTLRREREKEREREREKRFLGNWHPVFL